MTEYERASIIAAAAGYMAGINALDRLVNADKAICYYLKEEAGLKLDFFRVGMDAFGVIFHPDKEALEELDSKIKEMIIALNQIEWHPALNQGSRDSIRIVRELFHELRAIKAYTEEYENKAD